MENDSRKMFWLGWITLLILYLMLSFSYRSPVDLLNFNVPWAKQILENHFDLYNRLIVPSVDYPPLIPSLYAVFYKLIVHNVFLSFISIENLQNLALKMPGTIVTFAFGAWLYKKKILSPLSILIMVIANPISIVNTAMWGQSDIVLVSLIFITFYYLSIDKKPIVASFWMGIMLLTKLQGVYLFPLFIIALAVYYWSDIRRLALSVITGGVTLLVGWMPFIVMSKNLLTPVKVYLSGASAYSEIALSSFNFWQVVMLVKPEVSSNTQVIFGFTLNQMNYIILGLILMVSGILIVMKQNPHMVGFMYLIMIFTFTLNQHERYAIPALGFALLLVATKYKTSNLQLGLLGGLGLLMFLNETIMLNKFSGAFTNVPSSLYLWLSSAFTVMAVLLLVLGLVRVLLTCRHRG